MKSYSFKNENYDNNFFIEAKKFLFEILSYYEGTTEKRLERATEFLDGLIFQTKFDRNPFSNESTKFYYLAEYSKNILIPQIRDSIKELEESDPFDIHDWN